MSSDDDDATATSDIWPCSVCNWTFLSKGALEKHKKTHTNDKPFSCQECHVKFATSSGLKIHMRKHTGERPYKCNHCPKAFTTRSVLTMHMRGHTGEKPYVCKICGAGFTQNASLTYHLDKHNKNKQYKCQFCEESFKDLLRRLMHVRKVHYQETCGVCKRKFKTKKGLLAHEENHAYDKSVQCDHCGKIYPNKEKLKLHIKYHYDSYIKCSVCGKDVLKTQNYSHMKSHYPDQCSVCGKKYAKLKRHMEREHGNSDKAQKKIQDRIRRTQFNKFICKICGYKSNYRFTMTRHEKKCQLNPHFVQFICDFCQKECPDYQTFEAHVFEHSMVPARLPFVHKHNNFNPALHINLKNNEMMASRKHPKNAPISLPATKDLIANSTNISNTECSNGANSTSNKTLLTILEKCMAQFSDAAKSSSVVKTNREQCKFVQNVGIQPPHRSHVGQHNFLKGKIEEEISIKEESFVLDSFSYFQSEINPRQEKSSTSFMHYDGIMYMKPEQH